MVERQPGESHGFGILVFPHRKENVGVFAESFALVLGVLNIFVRGEEVRLIVGSVSAQSFNVALLVFFYDRRPSDEQMADAVFDRIDPLLAEGVSQRRFLRCVVPPGVFSFDKLFEVAAAVFENLSAEHCEEILRELKLCFGTIDSNLSRGITSGPWIGCRPGDSAGTEKVVNGVNE